MSEKGRNMISMRKFEETVRWVLFSRATPAKRAKSEIRKPGPRQLARVFKLKQR